jgi:hypothetical protein
MENLRRYIGLIVVGLAISIGAMCLMDTVASSFTGFSPFPGGGGSGGNMTYPGAGIAVSDGSAWVTSKTSPAGPIVDTNSTQSLSNKTIYGGTRIGADNATLDQTGNGTGNSAWWGPANTRLYGMVQGANDTVSYLYFGNDTSRGGMKTNKYGTPTMPTSWNGISKYTSGVRSAATIGTDYCGPVTIVNANANSTLTAAQLQCSGLFLRNHTQNATRQIHTLPTNAGTAFYSGIISVQDANVSRVLGVKPYAGQYLRLVADNGTITAQAQNATLAVITKTAGCEFSFHNQEANYWLVKRISGASDGNCTLGTR